jgi:hypothetical protein
MGFGLAEVIVKPGFRSRPGLDAPGGERSNDSGLVQFLDNVGDGLGFHLVQGGDFIGLATRFLARGKETAKAPDQQKGCNHDVWNVTDAITTRSKLFPVGISFCVWPLPN